MAKNEKKEKKGNTRDYRKRLTDMLIESLEENNSMPWEMGWHQIRPFNPATGMKYKGGNVVNLMLAQLEKGSDDPRWMTLKQANAAGFSIRKGAQATHIEYWDWGQARGPKKAEVDKDGIEVKRDPNELTMPTKPAEKRDRPGVFFPAMFNGSDIVGLPELRREMAWEPNELAERLIKAIGANIEHRAISKVEGHLVDNAAFYHPKSDGIVVPPRSYFKGDGDYYATVLHEIAHWTGHHSRLNRRGVDEVQQFGSPAYAKEELRADIAAMFLCSLLGVEGKVQNHAKYAESWLKSLKEDKHEIFRASRDAEQIVEFIFDLAPELREVIDSRSAQNLVPKDGAGKKLGSGVSADLPNFIPADAAPAPVGVGRADPRWMPCERMIREEAKKYNIDDLTVLNALELVAPRFTDVMNAAEVNGYGSDDMSAMLARNIVNEMRTADLRQQQWSKYCELVREKGSEHPVEHIEAVLQELGRQYQEIISRSSAENWTREDTDKHITSMIFGDEGRRPITVAYVDAIIEASEAVKRLKSNLTIEDDGDFMLEPIGLSGELPDDPGAVNEDFIMGGSGHSELVLEDAHVSGP